MLSILDQFVDWFVPKSALLDRHERSVARNFVLTHIFGPLMCQSMCVFLYRTDPNPGFACFTVIVGVWSFWALPFVLKVTQSIKVAALISVELLAFISLFGTYFYGGASSPCLPWLIVALLLGFFYFHDQQWKIVALFGLNVSMFFVVYSMTGFPEVVPLSKLSIVGWLSIISATIYMSWMAIYYSHIMSMRSEIERETDRYLAANEQLKIVKEMADAANRARTIFLTRMSHELRTPLNAVIGYSELILENMSFDGGDADRQKDVKSINAAGRHLLSLVIDVLDVSKIEANHIELQVEKFELDTLIEQVIATVKPLAIANGNTINVVKPGNIEYIISDQTKLRQVIVNLLSNASKFTRNGKITLAVKMDRKSTGLWLDVQVRDSGIGIADSEIANLFQNFGQASAATNHNYGGTGLGLALSQKLCTLMGGTITVSSELGRGSIFGFCIPAHVSRDVSEDADWEETRVLTPALAGAA